MAGSCFKLLEIPGNDWKCQEMAWLEMATNGLDIAINCWKFLEAAENSLKCLKMAQNGLATTGNGWKWLEVACNGLKCLEMTGNA